MLIFKKLLNILTNNEGTSQLKWFLHSHGIDLDASYYDRMSALVNKYVEVTHISPEEIPKDDKGELVLSKELFSSDITTCKSNANLYIYVYIVAVIDEIWKKNGVTDRMKAGPAKRIIQPRRNLIKPDLEEKLNATFIELEKAIGNLEATLAGHPEGIYYNDAEIMDLTKRDVTFKPEPAQDQDSQEISEVDSIKEIAASIGTGAFSGEVKKE